MRTLVLDTSAGSAVALVTVGEGVVLEQERSLTDPRRHAEVLSPMVRECLDAAGSTGAEFDAVVVGTGPAPFTGLRAGLATARTLARGWGIPVLGVSSLDAIALSVFDAHPDEQEIVIATDARRREVYAARYLREGEQDVTCTLGPVVCAPCDMPTALELGASADMGVYGTGTVLYPELLAPTHGGDHTVDLTAMARIARHRLQHHDLQGTPPGLATEPLYLRRPDIHQRKAEVPR